MRFQNKPLPIKHILFIGMLPSFLKIIVYRLMGYKIGKNVSIGIGSVVIGKDVEVGNHTTIGFLTIVRGRKIRIGNHVYIGSTTLISTPHIEIGSGALITERVYIGGQEHPDSRFILGKNTTVMYNSFINTARSVEIGDDSGIGGDCLLFTHGAWLSEFEGYPIKREPLVLGKSVWLPWRIFVMPGVNIGDGSVIGANSLVTTDIPELSLAMGSPAKVVASHPDFPKQLNNDEKEALFERIISDFLGYLKFHDVTIDQEGNSYNIAMTIKGFLGSRRKEWRLLTISNPEQLKDLASETRRDKHPDLVISLCGIRPEIRLQLNMAKAMWLDVENKERSEFSYESFSREAAMYFGLFGVRFDFIANEDLKKTVQNRASISAHRP